MKRRPSSRKSRKRWKLADPSIPRLKKSFLEQILSQMEVNKITKDDLAKKLGKSKSYVTRMLNGKTSIKIEDMEPLAKMVKAKVVILVREFGI
jgi:transcriptional regulator with XRE-family HTH domain